MTEAQKHDPRIDSLAKARATAKLNREKRLAEGHAKATGRPIDPEVIERHPELAEVAPPRSARETPVREAGRTGPRGKTEVRGRDGEVLSRKRTQTGDIFHIPLELIPNGWEYQWCAVTVTGNSEILLDQNLMFAENGWRPVPCDRYEGRFMPVGHKGSIIRGGQMLMERPKSLSDEARAEDIRMAKQQISDRNESLKLAGVKKGMADGFEMGGKYRGTGGAIRMEIDRELDINIAPSHELANDDQ